MLSGVLTDRKYREYINKEMIILSQDADHLIQPNSIDLPISHNVYRVQSSFLPGKSKVLDKLENLTMYHKEVDQSIILEKNNIYIIPLNIDLKLPEHIRGKTNPKSTTGRLDVFTRIITDYGKAFDEVDFGYQGKLYLEIMPRSFTIKVPRNYAFAQLRLYQGEVQLSDRELQLYYKNDPLLINNQNQAILDESYIKNGLLMSVNLKSDQKVCGYKAKRNSKVIDLFKLNHYRIDEFWELIPSCNELILEPEEFYIFHSKEKIRIPKSLCGDMKAYDVSFGELRTHYAGFFDSGFGSSNGAHIVMEVRSHDIPYLIEDSQKIYSVQLENNLEDPENLYGTELNSNYQNQELKLAKQFRMNS